MDEKEKGYGADYGATLTVIGAPDKGNVPHFLVHCTFKFIYQISAVVYIY